MKLYEIDQRLEALVDQETGELLDFDAFQKLQMERTEKIENMVLWYKDLMAQAKAIKDEVDKLTERKQAAERRAKGLLEYITFSLNGENLSTPRCTVSYRAAKALEVSEPSAAAFWLEKNGHHDMVVYSEPKLDKRAVTSLVKQGVEVPGVKIVERTSTQVR